MMCVDVKKSDGADVETVKKNDEDNNKDGEDKKDKLYVAIGEMGLWQGLLIFSLAVPCKISAAWQMTAIIFLAPKTQYRCLMRLNSTEDIVINECYSDCVEYSYITNFDGSIITEFGLICDKAWLANLAQTMFMFGVLVGSMSFGFIADRYGRRKALLIAALMQLVLSLVVSLSPEFWTLIIIRFLLGTCSAGLMVVSFVIMIEITGPKWRELTSALFHIPSAIGEMVMPAFAYYLRSWTAFSIGVGVPNVIFLLFFLIPESPRWLISVGKLEEASKVMERAAKRNKMAPMNYLEVAQTIAEESKIASTKEKQSTVSYIDLLTHPSLRVKNLLCCVAWFVMGIVYYGGKQYIGQTGSNVFILMALAGALQVPGQLISGYLLKRMGRRKSAIGFLFICGVCNGLLAMPDDWFYLKIVTGTVAVSAAAGAFTIIYTFTSELFPTVARNMAVGASSTTSRLGSMLAPFVAGMAQGAWVPPLVFATAPLLAIVACCCLPETKGRKLADSIDLDVK
ncbi:organic cation transporter protein-like [Ostrinia furnacalis]|uniref:organic cation transporter protein-like n=1 Tax=Ostrinia furnacalis TaxID=93504 RepID=UPI00103F38AC|nr:organic cation transporter protein-like [Ostrinia furnacalis]